MQEMAIERLVARYISDGAVVALGTSDLAEAFLKKLAFRVFEEQLNIRFVPTSMQLATLAAQLHLEIASIDEQEIDVAIEFVDQIDNAYNYIKSDSHSLIRDKMIAQSATDLIAIAKKRNLVEKLDGLVAFELVSFGAKRTLTELLKFGPTQFKQAHGKPFQTESGNLLALTKLDAVYALEDVEFQAKQIPGVVETGLFLGYADRMILYDPGLEAKSRIQPLVR